MNTKKFLFSFSIFMVLIGLSIEPSLSIFTHLIDVIAGKDGLITDPFMKGSVGAAFVNSGLVGLLTTSLLSSAKADFKSTEFASVMLAIGFAFLGKNIFNILPILLGGVIFTKLNHLDFKDTWALTFFGTSLSPLISEIMFVFSNPLYVRIPLALVIGIFTGYVVHLVAPHAKKAHKGYNLYNVGLAIGATGTAIVSVLRIMGFTIESEVLWDTRLHLGLYAVFSIFAICCIIYGYSQEKSFNNYKALLKTSGRNEDYISEFTFNTVLINIGFNTLLSLLFLYSVKIPLNGPILGGLITIMGFSSGGKHIINMAPIFLAVLFGNVVNLWNTTTPAIALVGIFLTGLAPIAGTFGFIPGFFFAIITLSVAQKTGDLHAGLNLYNTGFTIGITAIFMVPFYEHLFPNKIKS